MVHEATIKMDLAKKNAQVITEGFLLHALGLKYRQCVSTESKYRNSQHKISFLFS